MGSRLELWLRSETIVSLAVKRSASGAALDTAMKLLFHSGMDPATLILLLVGVPPTPSSLRVRVWRRLRSLGAVPLKRSAYLLPDTPERYEDFQWLAQEIEREGGEATLIRIQQIENISPENVQRLLHEPRDHDYRQLAARYRKVLQSLDKKPAVKGARLPEELAHLAREHQRIRDIDYFDAPSGAEVRRLEELSHQGEDCTFETRVRRARLRDRRLARLAEVVHEADLRDGKYPHEEARGIDVAVRALLAASPDDQTVLAQGMALFEGLYV